MIDAARKGNCVGEMEQAARPIVVIKRKTAHAAHHGGAWKVAYADFVTAMMALFIVLWLMSSSVKVKQAVAGYFSDPRGRSTLVGTDRAGAAEALPITREDMRALKRQIEKQIAQRPDLNALKKQIEITITPEGLRIELLEAREGTFFDSGSAKLNGRGDEMLSLLARELGGVPNRISIEGHTDAQRYADESSYGNWELSSDRANAARRLMQRTGLHAGQISQVRGFADQQLRIAGNPLDPSNRRISVIVNFVGPQLLPEAMQTTGAAEKAIAAAEKIGDEELKQSKTQAKPNDGIQKGG